jgi:hypothetical protein
MDEISSKLLLAIMLEFNDELKLDKIVDINKS